MPIKIDQATGLKIFDTRAVKATEKIAGKGYSEIQRRSAEDASSATARSGI